MIRFFRFDDTDFLNKMLSDEGLVKSEMIFDSGLTYVFEEGENIKGFFTFKLPMTKFLTLQHFCVGKDFRSPKMARVLAKALVEKVRSLKANKFIINCPIKNKGLQKILNYYFKTKPYANDLSNYYYLGTV